MPLTDKQEALAQTFVATGSVTRAGRAGGYKHLPNASRALASPEVERRVAQLQRARIANELLPLAIDTLKHVMSKETARDSDRVAAAKVAVSAGKSLGLLDDESASAIDRASKEELAGMLSDLRARRRELEAKVIDVEAIEEPEGGAFD